MITSERVRAAAARPLLSWVQKNVVGASRVSLPTIKRLEGIKGPLAAQTLTIDAIHRAFDGASMIFIPENGEGPGVRLRKVPRAA